MRRNGQRESQMSANGLQGDRQPHRGVVLVQSAHLGARRRGAVYRCSWIVKRMKAQRAYPGCHEPCQSQQLQRTCCQLSRDSIHILSLV